jgi:Arc/MetJ-type ribon-helix-helix transcriptional regulator
VGRSKEKLSVTVPAELIADVDRAVKRRRYPSCSAAVAAALEGWARAERDLEWDEYYRGASDQERREAR